MTFTLENLSGYTRYKVYIVAYTVAASNHSNDITIETMVGSMYLSYMHVLDANYVFNLFYSNVVRFSSIKSTTS